MASPIVAANSRGQPTDRPIHPNDLWDPFDARRKRVGEMMYAGMLGVVAPCAEKSL